MPLGNLQNEAALEAWLRQRFPILSSGVDARIALIYQGTGSPEGVVTANVGAIYQRLDGGAATSFYVKESGGGTNTGWVGK